MKAGVGTNALMCVLGICLYGITMAGNDSLYSKLVFSEIGSLAIFFGSAGLLSSIRNDNRR